MPEDYYHRLWVMKDPESDHYRSLDKSSAGNGPSKQAGLELLQRTSLVLLGERGAGKSMLLRQAIAAEADHALQELPLRRIARQMRLPVLVTCRKLVAAAHASSGPEYRRMIDRWSAAAGCDRAHAMPREQSILLQAIWLELDEASSKFSRPSGRAEIVEMLAVQWMQGVRPSFIAFDGWDEVPQGELEWLPELINSFQPGQQDTPVRVALASRPHGPQSGRFNLPAWRLCALSLEDAQKYLKTKYPDNSRLRLAEKIGRQQETLGRIIGNPLMLSLLARHVGWPTDGDVPVSSAQICRSIVDHLLRPRRQLGTYPNEVLLAKHRWLGQAAWQSMTRPDGAMSRTELLRLAQGEIKIAPRWGEELRGANRDPIAQMAQGEHAVLQETGNGWVFVHRIFEEYFAASWAVERIEHGDGALLERLEKLAWQPAQYQEMIVFAATLLRDPLPLLRKLVDAPWEMRWRRPRVACAAIEQIDLTQFERREWVTHFSRKLIDILGRPSSTEAERQKASQGLQSVLRPPLRKAMIGEVAALLTNERAHGHAIVVLTALAGTSEEAYSVAEAGLYYAIDSNRDERVRSAALKLIEDVAARVKTGRDLISERLRRHCFSAGHAETAKAAIAAHVALWLKASGAERSKAARLLQEQAGTRPMPAELEAAFRIGIGQLEPRSTLDAFVAQMRGTAFEEVHPEQVRAAAEALPSGEVATVLSALMQHRNPTHDEAIVGVLRALDCPQSSEKIIGCLSELHRNGGTRVKSDAHGAICQVGERYPHIDFSGTTLEFSEFNSMELWAPAIRLLKNGESRSRLAEVQARWRQLISDSERGDVAAAVLGKIVETEGLADWHSILRTMTHDPRLSVARAAIEALVRLGCPLVGCHQPAVQQFVRHSDPNIRVAVHLELEGPDAVMLFLDDGNHDLALKAASRLARDHPDHASMAKKRLTDLAFDIASPSQRHAMQILAELGHVPRDQAEEERWLGLLSEAQLSPLDLQLAAIVLGRMRGTDTRKMLRERFKGFSPLVRELVCDHVADVVGYSVTGGLDGITNAWLVDLRDVMGAH